VGVFHSRQEEHAEVRGHLGVRGVGTGRHRVRRNGRKRQRELVGAWEERSDDGTSRRIRRLERGRADGEGVSGSIATGTEGGGDEGTSPGTYESRE